SAGAEPRRARPAPLAPRSFPRTLDHRPVAFALTSAPASLSSPPPRQHSVRHRRAACQAAPGDRAMPDQTTTISTLRDAMRAFVRERDWEQFHSPKNLAMALSAEAAELME